MTARDKQIAEIERLQEALSRTRSKHLKRDYTKAIRRLRAELEEYDRYRSGR